MTHTVLQEGHGSVVETITDHYRLRLPYGQNCARFYLLTTDTSDLTAKLPDDQFMRAGGEPVYVVAVLGSQRVTLVDFDDNAVGSLDPGESVAIWFAGPGDWRTLKTTGVDVGTPLAPRHPVNIRITTSTQQGVDLRRDYEPDEWDGVTPVAIVCTIAAGVWIGSSTSSPALRTGSWPAGSTLVLIIEAGAGVSGRGGQGGRGGDVSGLLSIPGGAGGTGLLTTITTFVDGTGTLQGGGGGGGGTASVPANGLAGAGGGGGGGFRGGVGGAGGNPNGPPGAIGHISQGGAGGVFTALVGPLLITYSGGVGGGPGLNGIGGTAGAAGGAGGAASSRPAAVSLTVASGITVNGAHVTT